MTLNFFQIVGITILVLGIYGSRYFIDKAYLSLPEEKQLLILKSFKSSRNIKTIINAIVALALIFFLTRNPMLVIGIQYVIAAYVLFRISLQFYIEQILKKLDLPLTYHALYKRWTIIYYLSFLLFFLLFVFGPILEQHFHVDKCLDSGGRYDYDSKQCSSK